MPRYTFEAHEHMQPYKLSALARYMGQSGLQYTGEVKSYEELTDEHLARVWPSALQPFLPVEVWQYASETMGVPLAGSCRTYDRILAAASPRIEEGVVLRGQTKITMPPLEIRVTRRMSIDGIVNSHPPRAFMRKYGPESSIVRMTVASHIINLAAAGLHGIDVDGRTSGPPAREVIEVIGAGFSK